MTTEIQLIAACVAQPADDTCRLALADWYDENGTTDAQAARAEWIRLTSDKVRPKVRRLNGEPAWLKANAHRLWPNLWAKLSEGERLRFRSNQRYVWLRVAVPSRRTPRVTVNTVVSIRVTRGVTSGATVDMVRAEHVAADMAADEPLAPLRLFTVDAVSPAAYDRRSPGHFRPVYRRPFMLAGLGGVWEGLEGWAEERRWEAPEAATEAASFEWRLYDAMMHKDVNRVVFRAIHDSFTRWARAKAGVPHIPWPEAVAEEPRPPKLAPPPRIPSRAAPPEVTA